MPKFVRSELEEMVRRWIQANQMAEQQQTKDWTVLADFYTEHATYEWNMGPNQEFVVHGRSDIRDIALDYHMRGFQEDWPYPYRETIIDDDQGIVVCFLGPNWPRTTCRWFSLSSRRYGRITVAIRWQLSVEPPTRLFRFGQHQGFVFRAGGRPKAECDHSR